MNYSFGYHFEVFSLLSFTVIWTWLNLFLIFKKPKNSYFAENITRIWLNFPFLATLSLSNWLKNFSAWKKIVKDILTPKSNTEILLTRVKMWSVCKTKTSSSNRTRNDHHVLATCSQNHSNWLLFSKVRFHWFKGAKFHGHVNRTGSE